MMAKGETLVGYALSCRNLEEMMLDRELKVDHTTIYRWIQRYAPELERRVRPHLRRAGISYRIDETYIKIKEIWHYLYRAVDSCGDTIDFMLSPKRNAGAVFRFFRKMLGSYHSSRPKVISVDKNSAYPPAFKGLKKANLIDNSSKFRQNRSLNNIISTVPKLGKMRFMTYKNPLTTKILIDFVDRLCRDFLMKVSVILDNLAIHHSKKFMAWLKDRKENIEVFYLPPYSPGLNSDERLKKFTFILVLW